EPRVEHVVVLPQLAGAALDARCRLLLRDRRVAFAAVPDRYPVTPPELPRDAPWPDVLEVREHHVRLLRRVTAHATRAKRLDRRLRELGHLAPPLEHHERLDPVGGAVAVPDRVSVGLTLLEPAVRAQPVEDGAVGLR